MSKGGGAGKVYFVLYLAVVLELLIIIVERDEAEEHLHKKQQETMKIVESILSQLQSGAGTEGINTRPQDEITIPPPGVDIREAIGADIKPYRRYIVEVGVTDVTAAIKRKEGETDKEHNERLQKLVELANVAELQYQIFYSTSQDPAYAPLFLSDDEIRRQNIDFMKMQPGDRVEIPDGDSWEFLGVKQLNLDKKGTYDRLDINSLRATADIVPVYPSDMIVGIGPNYAPPNLAEDSIFFYSDFESRKLGASADGSLQKRSFVVNFQPPSRAGWYKLRFASRTNRILGVRAGQKAAEMDEESTVNIGTVQLTVRDLRKVLKELTSSLDKFSLPNAEDFIQNPDIDKFDQQMQAAIASVLEEPNAVEIVGKLRLFSYIAKLLAPGMSSNFEQNRGFIEFNIRVITPEPTRAEPTVSMANVMHCFDAVPHVFDFTISPYQAGGNAIIGTVLDKAGTPAGRIVFRNLDEIAGLGVAAPVAGSTRSVRGTLDAPLAPGNYTVRVEHTLQGRRAVAEADLNIYKTALNEESLTKISQRFGMLAMYGYPVVLDVIPESGNRIAPNQFRLYMAFDNNPQQPPIEGLAITQEMRRTFIPDAEKVSLRVTWMQPYSGVEVDLYPRREFEIRQEEANIALRGLQTEYSGQAARVRVRVTGIRVTKPFTGSDKEADIRVRVGEVNKASGLQTYNIAAGPTIEDEGDGSYSITFELAGALPRGETRIRGTLNIPVFATAINPVNGKASREEMQTVTIQVNYEPDRGGPRRR